MNAKSKWSCFLFLCLLALSHNLCTKNSQIPNDEFFKHQISFFNDGSTVTIDRVSYKKSPIEFSPKEGIHLNILPAWEITTGSAETIVAVMDDGFFYNHEDIKQNLWENPGGDRIGFRWKS